MSGSVRRSASGPGPHPHLDPVPGSGFARPDLPEDSLTALQRLAGNQATTLVVQRLDEDEASLREAAKLVVNHVGYVTSMAGAADDAQAYFALLQQSSAAAGYWVSRACYSTCASLGGIVLGPPGVALRTLANQFWALGAGCGGGRAAGPPSGHRPHPRDPDDARERRPAVLRHGAPHAHARLVR